MSFIKFENIVKLFTKYWEKFLVTGVSYTLLLAAITVAFGAVIACLLAGMKLSRIAPLRWLSTAYIEIIRGTPMLLQLYFFYFALPALIPALNKQKFLCIAIALVCNSAAYVSEVIRSGIQSVDAGQSERISLAGVPCCCPGIPVSAGTCVVCATVHSDTGFPPRNRMPSRISAAIPFRKFFSFNKLHRKSVAAHAINAVWGTTAQIHT